MKRFLACLVAVACLMTAFAFALAEGESVDMRVIKCSVRVNIRQYPNINATIVGKAPLGAVLVGCQKSAKAPDWYAVVYEGVAGYIRGDFLEPVGETAAPVEEAPVEEAPVEEAPVEEAPVEQAVAEEPLPDLPSDEVPEYDPASEVVEEEPIIEDVPVEEAPVEEAPVEAAVTEAEPAPAEEAPVLELVAPVEEAPAEAASVALPAVENAPIAAITDPVTLESDTVALEADAGATHVVARRIYDSEREYMMVAGLDAEGNELWHQETATSGITELTLTEAFVAGIAARPLVMLYNAEVGLAAIDPANGNIRWLLGTDEVHLGASVSYAVGGNGIVYIGGYYGPDPVAIDANGTVLWQSNVGSDDIYWLTDIELKSDGIVCTYDNMGGVTGTVEYDYSGNVKG